MKREKAQFYLESALAFFVAVSVVFTTLVPSYGMKKIIPDEKRSFSENLAQTVPLWFADLDNARYQTCWKSIYAVIFSSPEDNKDLVMHHADHHMVKIEKQKACLPLNDPHDIRIVYGSENAQSTEFRNVVRRARNALIQRLEGEYQEYLPFSLAPGCMEIPLAPNEENAVISSFRFCGRITESDKGAKQQEVWCLCSTRVKGIGLQICEDGIKSIFLATEGIYYDSDKKTIKVSDSSNRPTSVFQFKNFQTFSNPEEVVRVFRSQKISPYLCSEIVPLFSKMTEQSGKKLFDILDDPLHPNFSGKVLSFRSILSKGEAEASKLTIDVAQSAKIRLQQHILIKHPVAIRFATSITKSFTSLIKPSLIRLSHVSLSNPAVSQFDFDSVKDWDVAFVRPLLDLIELCQSEADIFAVAMLLAKSQQITLKELKIESSVTDVPGIQDPVLLAIERSATEFQIAKTCREGILIPSDRLSAVLRIFEDRDDVAIKVNFNGLGPETVRIYHEPSTGAPLVRVRTRGDNDMCALMALGALTIDDVQRIWLQFLFWGEARPLLLKHGRISG